MVTSRRFGARWGGGHIWRLRGRRGSFTMTSAITTPSKWAFRSKNPEIITQEQILVLIKGGFRNGVQKIEQVGDYIELHLTYCTSKERVKARFGTAPVACICLKENQTVSEVEEFENLREKFEVKPLETKDVPTASQPQKRKRAPSKKAPNTPKPKKLAFEEPSSDEQDSDLNYFRD